MLALCSSAAVCRASGSATAAIATASRAANKINRGRSSSDGGVASTCSVARRRAPSRVCMSSSSLTGRSSAAAEAAPLAVSAANAVTCTRCRARACARERVRCGSLDIRHFLGRATEQVRKVITAAASRFPDLQAVITVCGRTIDDDASLAIRPPPSPPQKTPTHQRSPGRGRRLPRAL